MIIYCLRHATTSWNLEKKIQGRRDILLEYAIAEKQVGQWRLPREIQDIQCFSSPLQRCIQTAKLCGYKSPILEDSLIEMDWGSAEGKTLKSQRACYGTAFEKEERKGLDFNFFKAESPRMVQTRILSFFKKLLNEGQKDPVLCFTHKGVLRVLFAAALHWDMKSDSPQKIEQDCIHSFNLINCENHIKITPHKLNYPL